MSNSNLSAKPIVGIEKFKGQFHSFTKLHINFDNILIGQKVPQSDWKWIINQNVENWTTAQSMNNDLVCENADYNDIVVESEKNFDRLNAEKVRHIFNNVRM